MKKRWIPVSEVLLESENMIMFDEFEVRCGEAGLERVGEF